MPHGSTVWGALLVTGLFAGALGYLIATWVQARTTAARAALVFTLEAPFAALFGVLLADEILGWAGWLGCAVMMAGILVAEPAAAATLRRSSGRGRCRGVTLIVLGALSAFLFGAMTLLVRIALRTRHPRRGREPAHHRARLPGHGGRDGGTRRLGSRDGVAVRPRGALAPGVSQILFTFAVRDAGASRTSVTVGTAPLFAVATALVFLGEPLVAGLVLGAASSSRAASLLASDRARPEHFKRIGLGLRAGRRRSRSRRGTPSSAGSIRGTDVAPVLAASRGLAAGTVVSLAFVVGAALGYPPGGGRVRRRPGSVRPVVRLPVRGVLPRTVSVVSPIVATESLWGVMLSWLVLRKSERVGRRLVVGAALVVAGGVLIGLYR